MRRIVLIAVAITVAAAADGKPLPSDRPLIDSPRTVSESRLPAPLAPMDYQDTVYFGGTTWAADSMRWEALRDSVWTFESGVGSWINTGQLPGKPLGYHGGMEGWAGYVRVPEQRFERTATCAISGTYSLWAGVDSAAASALCYVAGQGYGNNWSARRSKTFFYPGSGSIALSYDYAVEAQPGFDYLYALIDTTGNGSAPARRLAEHTGLVSGHEALNLTQAGGELPSVAGNIVIWFAANSSSRDSDQDGRFPTTCGHSVIDNIILSGAVNDSSDFESGEDGWVLYVPPPGEDDYSHLAHISDLPPMQVPGPCAVADSVLVFHDGTFVVPEGQNWAISPWIDLKRAGCTGRPGKLVTYDLYSEFFTWPSGDDLFVQVMVRSHPGTPCGDGFRGITHEFDIGPWCSSNQPLVVDLSPWVSAEAAQVQIAIGVFEFKGYWSQTTDTPWFDNVRFGVYGTPVGVPESQEKPPATLMAALPNPFRSTTRIPFTTAEEGHAALSVFDVAGRKVRTLVDAPVPAGPHEISWDARDDAGRRVPAGLYFYRLTTGGFTAARKLLLVK